MVNANQNSTEFLEGQVADLILNSGAAIQKRVVNDLVDEVLECRANLLTESIKRLRAMNTKLEELDKPDKVCFDEQKKEKKGFSEKRVKEIDGFQKEIKKLDDAVVVVLQPSKEDNRKDWCKLKEVLKALKVSHPCCNHC